MSIENIKITKHEQFIEIKCADGHYISNWDGEDIMKYTAAKVMYCPLDFDINAHDYYCVTEEEHNANIAEIEEKIKEMHENRDKDVQNSIGK